MGSNSSTAFATRLSVKEATMVEEALERTGQSRTEFMARAIRYYIKKNPDDIPELYPKGSVNRLLSDDLQ